jgi:glycosyltransferase involved in cell wall biosynthesis
MRIAFLNHPIGVRDPVNPVDVWTSSRGLTGSEIAFFKYAEELTKLGHDVNLFTKFTTSDPLGGNGPYCIPYDQWESIYSKQSWDAACCWTVADPLSLVGPGIFRFLNHQCNGFSVSLSGWEKYVDIIAPLSHTHARALSKDTSFSKDKWRILYNGVDCSKFYPENKESGKLIWASSLDRGLHWLLESFPYIKRKAPNTELHVFYDFHSIEHAAEVYYPGGQPYFTNEHFELGNRARYILRALQKLEGKGVHVHKSVSRSRIEQEMKTSSILAYPLDSIYFTETFGVVVLEACASGTIPVLCLGDAFGELWGEVAESVPPPFKDHKNEYLEKLIKCLTDDAYRDNLSKKCVDHAKKFEWSVLAKGLEKCLLTKGQEGLPLVDW